jgi:uncharacterized protein YerC
MVQQNKTKTASTEQRTPAPVAPTSISALESELARAKSVQQHLEARITAAKTEQEQIGKLRAGLQSLATTFGLKDEHEILSMLRKEAAPPKPIRRFKVTEQLEARIIEMVRSGKSGNQIKKATGISLPTIQALKGRHGLIQHRTLSPAFAATVAA